MCDILIGIELNCILIWASQVVLVAKNPPPRDSLIAQLVKNLSAM